MTVLTWKPFLAISGFLTAGLVIFSPRLDIEQDVSVAFIGNSMQYFNDSPRFMEALAGGRIKHQNSCLHGDASLSSLLTTGNGLAQKYNTDNAIINIPNRSGTIYDFGACTVQQLLFGYDETLLLATQTDDDYFAYYELEGKLYSDALNPCLVNDNYMAYLEDYYADAENIPQWDYIVMNDNTRNPGRYNTRQLGLQTLRETYIPWLQELDAVPIFIDTHAYWSSFRDMGGLVDVPTFTSLTYQGYREYAELVAEYLPESQAPRIAPIGIAYLTVWEENRSMWNKMIYRDEVHATPYGTFLQGCVLHYTIFGQMPSREHAFPSDMSSLWSRARVMQPKGEPSVSIPSAEEAEYLFYVAERVCRYGHRPDSFTLYEHGEAAYYTEMYHFGNYS